MMWLSVCITLSLREYSSNNDNNNILSKILQVGLGRVKRTQTLSQESENQKIIYLFKI